MLPILDDVIALLRRDLEGLQREVAWFPDDQSLWATAGGVTNSAGNLALHVAGNIQHFIGHEMGGLPFERDRDAEFGRRQGSATKSSNRCAARSWRSPPRFRSWTSNSWRHGSTHTPVCP